MRGAPLVPSAVTKTLVCVDSFSNHEVSGTIINPYIQAPVNFNSISDMIGVMEGFFNEISFPHAYFQDRSFNPKTKTNGEILTGGEVRRYMSDDIFTSEHGQRATFVIQVQFRQNATWQGTITWTEEKKTQKFRSTLEMIKLMDNALAEHGEDEDEPQPVANWE